MGRVSSTQILQWFRAHLVIVFKNCCLKRCENCGLKSVVEKHVFSVSKKKKCVWYHGLNNIFQCSKNIKYVFGMYVWMIKKANQRTKIIFF